jgi:hypothetical protein
LRRRHLAAIIFANGGGSMTTLVIGAGLVGSQIAQQKDRGRDSDKNLTPIYGSLGHILLTTV